MEEFISPLAVTVFGALVSLVIYMIKKMIERIQKLEAQTCDMTTRKETRILIKDKTEPLREQMKNIDEKLDRIIHIMLNDGR